MFLIEASFEVSLRLISLSYHGDRQRSCASSYHASFPFSGCNRQCISICLMFPPNLISANIFDIPCGVDTMTRYLDESPVADHTASANSQNANSSRNIFENLPDLEK